MLAFLRRHTVKSFDVRTRKLLYLTLVRPYLGYASEVWAPQTITGIAKAESLQRRATKYILNTKWQDNITYQERLHKLKLLPLSYWHELKDLIFYYKCRSGQYSFPISNYINPKSTRLTRHCSSLDLTVPKCRTKLFQASYFNRITKLWNNLPDSARTCTSDKKIKALLTKFYNEALSSTYDVNNFNTWKSICCKCCSYRNILSSTNCCY